MTTGKVISIDLLKQALLARGWRVRNEHHDGKLHVFFTSGTYEWSTKRSIVEYPMIDSPTRQIIDDKIKTAAIAAELSIQTPRSIIVKSSDSSEAVGLLALSGLVVVKPADGSASQGVTIGIDSKEKIEKAIQDARQYSKTVLVQEQVTGSEYRFTCLNGVVVSVIEKRFPYLIGDGVSTLRQLMDNENAQRVVVNQTSMIQYPELQLPTASDPSMVLEKGSRLQLGSSSLVSKGTSLYEVSDAIHPGYKALAEQLVQKIGADFVVVDIIIKNMTEAPAAGNYWLLELNGGPALTMYTSIRAGKPVDVLSLICDDLDRRASLANQHQL